MSEQRIRLGYVPREWQRTVHVKKKNRNVLIIHRRAGKTVAAVMELIDSALRCTKKNGRFAYIAPFRSQAKDLAWTYLKDYALKIPHTIVSETELWVEFPNQARIRCYGSDNANAIRGLYLDGAVVDEFADVDPDFVGQVLMPTLSDRNGWLIMMGTPRGTDALSQYYYRHKDNPDWYCAKMDVTTTKALNDEQLAVLRSGMTDSEYAQEMMCDLEASVPDVLLSGNEVEEAMLRSVPLVDYGSASIVLGVDVARQGPDRTVITRRQGLKCFPPIIMRQADNVQVALRLMREISDHNPDAVFIDGTGGFGGGVVDYCRQFNIHIIEVHFGSSPLDPRFRNCRAEMWFGMAAWVKGGGSLPPLPEYRTELTTSRYKHDDSGKLMLEKKEDVKGRGLPSPDLADSLALTFYNPVLPSKNRHGETSYRLAGRTMDKSASEFYD